MTAERLWVLYRQMEVAALPKEFYSALRYAYRHRVVVRLKNVILKSPAPVSTVHVARKVVHPGRVV